MKHTLDDPQTALLDVRNLQVSFKTRRGIVIALHDVSFEVGRGEMIGIVGESGSGKSVASYAVLGLLDRAGSVDGGDIEYGGMDLRAARESEMRDIRGREISMIFQNPRVSLNPIRRVGHQIEDVLIAHSQATRLNAKERAIAMLDLVKIREPEKRYHTYPFEMSGGMCQRVVIALALACKPELLIADEPTTGLDVTTQKAVMDLLVDLARARNMATILITHDLGVASAYCNRIVVMEKGRVVEAGETGTLFTEARHPYTQKLIRATPRRTSRLRQLLSAADPRADTVAPERRIDISADAPPLLAVKDLVKSYPVAGGVAGPGLLGRATRLVRGTKGEAEEGAGLFNAVDHVSLDLRAGESLGLVGESGCGKSTLSSIIARLIDATSGTVEFEGVDLTATPASDFARSPHRPAVQMVFQDPTESLNPRFTAFQSIADPLRRIAGVKGRQALGAKVEELSAKVGLPSALLGRFPHQLSGGQKARVGIARAIALDPRLLILDEPTSALDVSVQAVVLNLLADLRAELGMSYIFVSHDLTVVRLLCDRVIVMRQGKIVEQGAADAILDRPSDPYTRSLIDAIPHFQPVAGAAAPLSAAPPA